MLILIAVDDGYVSAQQLSIPSAVHFCMLWADGSRLAFGMIMAQGELTAADKHSLPPTHSFKFAV